MFYLIGGAPRCGKTTLAKRLSERIGIPWISTDTLESVIIEYAQPEIFSALFPKSLMRRQTNQSNDEMYTTYSSEQIVNAYRSQGKSLERGIQMFIECESKYNHDFILEGHHIHPELVTQLQEKFKIKSIFIGRDSVEKTHEAITQYPNENDWVISKTKNQETYEKIAEMLVAFSQFLKKSADENKLLYVSVEDGFDEKIEELVNDLETTV